MDIIFVFVNVFVLELSSVPLGRAPVKKDFVFVNVIVFVKKVPVNVNVIVNIPLSRHEGNSLASSHRQLIFADAHLVVVFDERALI